MPGPTPTVYTFTALPAEVPPSPASEQPASNIEVQFNQLVRALKEIQACINSGTAGTDVNGIALQNYSAIGLIERLVAIEDAGKIQDSDKLQIASGLTAGDRYMRFILGALTTYKELFYDNTNTLFKLRDQSGVLQRLQIGTPTAADDATSKSYVDGLISANIFAKSMWCGTPTKVANKTFSIAHIYGYDSTGTHVLSKSTSSTIDLSTTGELGIASSVRAAGSSGTISVTSSSAAITGSGTSFTTDFIAGDWITTNGGAARKILTVTNNTSMTATTNFSATESGVVYSRGGVAPSSEFSLNLYALGHWSGMTSFFVSTRNTIGGDTLVDLPQFVRTGTASVTNGSPLVNGVSTLFTTEFRAGDRINLISGGTLFAATILSIQSNTQLTLTANSGVNLSGYGVYSLYTYYRQLPFSTPLDGSSNQLDYSVSGFPWNTKISLAGGVSTIVTGHASTSNTSKNLITSSIAPVLTTMIDVVSTCSSVAANTTAPSYFSFGSASGVYNYFVRPWEYTWNTLGTSTPGANLLAATDICLDSSNQVWYASNTTNASGSLWATAFRLGKWT